MPRGNPTINIGLTSDIDAYIKELKGSLKTLGNQGVDLGLADSVKNEINEIEKMLDGLQKTMKTISGTKLSSATFSKFQSQIGQQLEALDKRTTALENGMDSLINTMSKADGGKLASALSKVKDQMSETLDLTNKMTDAIGTIQNAAKKDTNIRIVTQDQVKYLQDTLEALKNIEEYDGSKLSSNVDLTRKNLVRFLNEYLELSQKIQNVPIDSDEYRDLQQEIVDTIKYIKEFETDIYTTFTNNKDLNNILEKPIKDLKKAPSEILSSISKVTNQMIADITSSVREMENVVENASGSIKDEGTKGYSIPVNIRTSANTLKKQVVKLVESVRPLIKDQNLEIGISLVTDWGNRKQRELFKEFQNRVGSIIDSSDSAEIKAIYDDITKYFNDEIRIKIKSDIDVESDRIIKKIENIRKNIKENPLSLDIAANGKQGKSQKLFDKSVLNNLDALIEKLKELQLVSKLTRNDLIKINSILEDLKFPGVSANIEELDKSFANMQKRISALNGSLSKKDNKTELKSILKLYKEYEALGGKKTFNDLSSQKNIQNWFKNHINDTIDFDASKYRTAGKKIGEEFAAGIRDGIAEVVKACQEMIQSALSAIQTTQDSHSDAKEPQNLSHDFVGRTIRGIKDRIPEVEKTAEQIAEAINKSADNQKELNKLKDNEDVASAQSIKQEANKLEQVSKSAKDAAISKEAFSEANKEVLNSIVASLNGLNNEGKAFENLNKLINNLGGKNSDAKLKSTVDGLKEIVKVLSYPLDGSTFIDALEKIASSGSNLGDIATILKASNKNLLEAVDTLNKASGIDLDDILNTKSQEILDNARIKLLELGGKDSQLINISNITKTKDGFLEIVGVIKTANDQLQEFTLHTKDGIEMQNVGISENTARLAKQMKVYAQVEQFFDKMKEQGKMIADGAFFDPNVDPETWKMLLGFAEEYRDYLGEIRSITMQTRQDKAGGTLLESFSINGVNGNHLTVGSTGNIVASAQDVLGTEKTIEKIQELIKARKQYNELIQKRLDNSATNQELADLNRLENKLSDVTGSVQRLNDVLGDNEASRYFEELQAALTSDYNNQIAQFITNAQNKINNAATSKQNQYTTFVSSFKKEIDDAADNIERLNRMIKDHPADTPWSDQERASIKAMVDQIGGVTAGIKNLETVYQPLSDVDKLISKISKDLNDNTAMSGGLKSRFTELRNQIKLLRGDSDNVEDGLSQIDKVKFKALVAEFNRLHSEMLETQQTGNSFFKSLTKAAQSRTVQFLARYLSFYDVIRYTRQAVDEIQKLDYALVDLRKTTTMSNSELNEFYFNANDVAKELGTTTEEIINQAAAWSRLGYSSKEAATEMAALSSQFAAISPGMSLDNATDGLVSTMQAFHIEVDKAERDIMDNVNRIGNTFATSNDEIMEMLKRSSAAMNAANNTLEETIALESAAVQITRNAETTGTAFRTISMRIRGYDEETEEFIGNVEQLEGDIADLTKTAKAPGGISLFTDKDKTTYKSTYQLLKDISEIYNDLTDKQQAGLLEKLAGKRGGQVLAGILSPENFSEVERALQQMSDAAGAADDEMKIVEESIDFRLNRLKETWVGTLQDLIDRGEIGVIVDGLTKISEAIGFIVDKIGLLNLGGLGLEGFLMSKGLGLTLVVVNKPLIIRSCNNAA